MISPTPGSYFKLNEGMMRRYCWSGVKKLFVETSNRSYKDDKILGALDPWK